MPCRLKKKARRKGVSLHGRAGKVPKRLSRTKKYRLSAFHERGGAEIASRPGHASEHRAGLVRGLRMLLIAWFPLLRAPSLRCLSVAPHLHTCGLQQKPIKRPHSFCVALQTPAFPAVLADSSHLVALAVEEFNTKVLHSSKSVTWCVLIRGAIRRLSIEHFAGPPGRGAGNVLGSTKPNVCKRRGSRHPCHVCMPCWSCRCWQAALTLNPLHL